LPFRLEYPLSGSFFVRETIASVQEMSWTVVKKGRNAMRAFILACVVAGIIAGGAAAILENLVQEPSSVAFAEPSARP
jgi:hypothetical protein